MIPEEIKDKVSKGENLTTEFKECINEVSGSVYETICSFLNHSGGDILLGIKDSGEIVGVNKNTIADLIKSIANTVNNMEIFTPRVAIYPEIITLNDNNIIHIYVPSSPSVHSYKKKFYDRNGDADLDVTQDPGLLASLFNRKTVYSSERQIIPMLTMSDLDPHAFNKCKKLISITKPAHPWLTMTNEEILRSAKLFVKDSTTGLEGICLAGLLLFGTEDSIMTFWPIYRIEAIYRNKTYAYHLKNDLKDTTRYDDRITERRNLIQAYYTLSEFVERHLPDKFYLEDSNPQRQDIRSNIFREVIANLCVHREYSNPTPGIFEIFSDRVIVSNWSKLALGEKSGMVSIEELQTYPKNPLLINVFRQLGWVEELGSGFRNIKKYAPLYYTRSVIEIQNTERFIFAMTYQDTSITSEGNIEILSVKNSELSSTNNSKSVNESENPTDIISKDVNSVNYTKFNLHIIARALVTEFISGISDKIATRMTEELVAIYNAKQLTKQELKDRLDLSDEQAKIDLRELTRNRLLDQNNKDKTYKLSEKISEKIRILKLLSENK